MIRLLLAATAAFALATSATAQEEPEGAPSPNESIAQAEASDWKAIDAEDLLVMTLAPDRDGNERQVVIQLMPPPFSQDWVENIRTLARAGWYDGVSINRVQDNYVVQWGDPNVDNPEAEGEAKPLPKGLRNTRDEAYFARRFAYIDHYRMVGGVSLPASQEIERIRMDWDTGELRGNDVYATGTGLLSGWPLGFNDGVAWPVHCYGMVGVGRGYSPDTGSGAELYTVIGHAPRHLDRNIALAGRVIEGIENLSSLPRGKGDLGFYIDPAERLPIQWVRLVSDLPPERQIAFEYLSTDSEVFARYADARANRRDPFFIEPAGGADICNIPVPVRRVIAE